MKEGNFRMLNEVRGGFTEDQQRLINHCKGYGWRKFAESVEKQEKCSPKQEKTLHSMVEQISLQQERSNRHYCKRTYKRTYKRNCDGFDNMDLDELMGDVGDYF